MPPSVDKDKKPTKPSRVLEEELERLYDIVTILTDAVEMLLVKAVFFENKVKELEENKE